MKVGDYFVGIQTSPGIITVGKFYRIFQTSGAHGTFINDSGLSTTYIDANPVKLVPDGNKFKFHVYRYRDITWKFIKKWQWVVYVVVVPIVLLAAVDALVFKGRFRKQLVDKIKELRK